MPDTLYAPIVSAPQKPACDMADISNPCRRDATSLAFHHRILKITNIDKRLG